MPSLSLSDGESLAGRSKKSPVEKAVCDRRHIIIKKLCHRVITFTPGRILLVKQQVSLQLIAETDIEATSCRTGRARIRVKIYQSVVKRLLKLISVAGVKVQRAERKSTNSMLEHLLPSLACHFSMTSLNKRML